MENIYYIYALLDPRIKEQSTIFVDSYVILFEFKPIYIGKGKKWRLTQHFSESSLKKNTYKNNKIKKIISEGYKPISIKIIENLTEKYAYELEIKTISTIGLSNLTNKDDGGIGRSSYSMMGENNPMFGKKRPRWIIDKMMEGKKSKINYNKGKTLNDIFDVEKSNEIKKKQSNSRKGKTWEEYFGEETAKRVREERSIQRKGYKHSEETKNKIKDKICTIENIEKRQKIILENRFKKFDDEFKLVKQDIITMINNGYIDNEIIKRIKNLSRYKIKKMIFLIKNNLNSDYYFKNPK